MTDQPAPLRRIVVAGGGTAGWMVAAALATLFPEMAITLVESATIGTVGVGEATIPPIVHFNALVGLTDRDLVTSCAATCKLGIAFDGWTTPGSSYLHPFGAFGAELDGVPFHQLWLRAAASGTEQPLAAYSLNATALQDGRCGRSREAAPFAAWHFDAALYAGRLRTIAERRGVTRIVADIRAVERDATGDVAALVLDDKRRVAGDLFVDCTGFRSLLLGDALKVPFVDWSAWLPCDRAIALPTARDGAVPPVTRAIAHAGGWRWRIPLQHRAGNGIVYASALMADDAAEAALREVVGCDALAPPRLLRFTAGHRARLWERNVVALGLAGGFLEPLESTSIHLVQSALSRLATLLPAALPAPGAAAAAAFNAASIREYAAIRDFLVLHYAANRRDEPFWRDRAAMALPDTLRDRLDLWRDTGQILRDAHELFSEASWVAVLVGQGIVPTRWTAVADRVPGSMLDRHLDACAANARRAAASLPAHGDHLAGLRG